MSDAAESKEPETNDNVDQIKPEVLGDPVTAQASEVKKTDETMEETAEDVKTDETNKEATEDIKIDDTKQEATNEAKPEVEQDGDDVMQQGDEPTADVENGEQERQETSPYHKRKRPHDADNNDDHHYPKKLSGGSGSVYKKRSNNIKSTFDMEESNDHDEIRKQVEFYFSDSNLPTDNYLLGLTEGYKNVPVELRVIHQFKRMRHFQPYSEVANAIRASDFLDLNEKDEITRKIPLDEKFTSDVNENKKTLLNDTMAREVYVKGFGHEQSSTHRDIEAFFDPYGPIKSVRLRRHNDDTFKGSVFVEFATSELQERFLSLSVKPQWEVKKDEMVDLEIMSLKAYVDDKHAGDVEKLVKPKNTNWGYNRYQGKPDYHRGGKKFEGKDRGDRRSGGGKYNDRNGDDKRRGGGRHDDKKHRDGRDRGGNRRGGKDRRRRNDDEENKDGEDGKDDRDDHSQSHSPARDSRGHKRKSFDGEEDDWRERRDHDQEEDRKEAKRSRRDEGDHIDKLKDKRSKRRNDDEEEQGEAKRSKREEPALEAEAAPVTAGAEQAE